MSSASEPAPAAKPSLHVALDVRPWQMSGIGSYVRELLGAFARLQAPVRWTFVGPPSLRDAMPDGLDVAAWVDFDRPLYHPLATIAYPRLDGVDVFHYPHYNLPWRRGRRALVNVFDLFHMRYGTPAKRSYQHHFLRRLRRLSCALTTPSQKTADELTEQIGIAPSRIHTVHLGAGRALPLPGVAIEDLRKSPPVNLEGQPLRPPWLLAVGIDQPHKNFDFLLAALGLYAQRRPDAPPLVWVGPSAEACRQRFKTLPASLRDRLAIEPHASPERLEALYRDASALAFPSLDEGFGLPPLEAMARGVPVLCARREPMVGLLGGGALYFEPTDSASLWRMLDRLFDGPGVREEMIARGRDQARLYDWDRCARATFQLYAKLAERPKR